MSLVVQNWTFLIKFSVITLYIIVIYTENIGSRLYIYIYIWWAIRLGSESKKKK